jgi:hypothetical protein
LAPTSITISQIVEAFIFHKESLIEKIYGMHAGILFKELQRGMIKPNRQRNENCGYLCRKLGKTNVGFNR